MTRLPVNARSECVEPSVLPCGGDVESSRMFHAACSASHRPALRVGRGSGVGAVADTTGVTGFGIVAGGGSGGAGAGACAAGVAACGAGCCARSSADPPAAKAAMRLATTRPLIGSAIRLVILLVPQHFVHASNLDRLIGLNVRCELVDQFVLCGAVRLEERVNH